MSEIRNRNRSDGLPVSVNSSPCISKEASWRLSTIFILVLVFSGKQASWLKIPGYLSHSVSFQKTLLQQEIHFHMYNVYSRLYNYASSV